MIAIYISLYILSLIYATYIFTKENQLFTLFDLGMILLTGPIITLVDLGIKLHNFVGKSDKVILWRKKK